MTDTNLRSSLSLLPQQALLRARLEDHRLQDTGAETAAQLDAVFSGVALTGRSVAVAVGSRGIDQIATVVKTAIARLKRYGARPFIFPAMGSHGGHATPASSIAERRDTPDTPVPTRPPQWDA